MSGLLLWAAARDGIAWFTKQLIVNYGNCIEASLSSCDSSGPLDVSPKACPTLFTPAKRRRDPHVYDQVSMHSGKKGKTAAEREEQAPVAKLAHSLSKSQVCKARQQHMWRYWSCCRQMVQEGRAIDLHVSLDASRVGGQDILLLAALNASTGQCCWLPPQAPLSYLTMVGLATGMLELACFLSVGSSSA
jgi:hypothetical protein